MRYLPTRRVLASLSAGLLLVIVWCVAVLLFPYSTPAVLTNWLLSYKEASSAEVLMRMEAVVRLRRYDWAIKIGTDWTQNNSDSFGWVNTYMGRISLLQADGDSENVEEHVRRALTFRDRARHLFLTTWRA
jgi:hypothetical protein